MKLNYFTKLKVHNGSVIRDQQKCLRRISSYTVQLNFPFFPVHYSIQPIKFIQFLTFYLLFCISTEAKHVINHINSFILETWYFYKKF